MGPEGAYIRPRTFIVAEFGSNHFGSIDTAKELIKAAKDSGADSCKSQLYDCETVQGYMPRDIYRQCAKLFDHLAELFEYAKSIDITLFISYFDERYIAVSPNMVSGRVVAILIYSWVPSILYLK